MMTNGGPGTRQFGWQDVVAFVSILIAMLSVVKAWFWTEWRLDRIEVEQATIRSSMNVNLEKLDRVGQDVRVLRLYFQSRGWIDEQGNTTPVKQ